MSVCRATKRDGEPCTLSATDGNGFCWAHSPRHASERKRIASRGGRGKGGGELPELRRQLKDLAAGVLDGTVDRGRAAVANQLYNTLIRAIEQERRVRESEELAREVEEMRELLESRKESRYG